MRPLRRARPPRRALGYISKQEATHKIVEAIHRVLEGKVYLSEHMADRLFIGSAEPWIAPRSRISPTVNSRSSR